MSQVLGHNIPGRDVDERYAFQLFSLGVTSMGGEVTYSEPGQ